MVGLNFRIPHIKDHRGAAQKWMPRIRNLSAYANTNFVQARISSSNSSCVQRQSKPFSRCILHHSELHEYLTKELYSRNSSLLGHWRNQGCVDNIVTFPNAEKFHPVDRRTVSAPIQRLKPRLLRVMTNFKPLLIEPIMHSNSKDAEASQLIEIWSIIKKKTVHI